MALFDAIFGPCAIKQGQKMNACLRDSILSRGTYEDAAEATGISIRTLKRVCTEETYDPKLSVLKAVAEYTGLPVAALIEPYGTKSTLLYLNDQLTEQVMPHLGGMSLFRRENDKGMTYELRGDELEIKQIHQIKIVVSKKGLFDDYYFIGLGEDKMIMCKLRVKKKEALFLSDSLNIPLMEFKSK
ncbi:helix-turn-helix transcriptional regulator [Klebsiella pneumoniae]